jgi:hypothetical protein
MPEAPPVDLDPAPDALDVPLDEDTPDLNTLDPAPDPLPLDADEDTPAPAAEADAEAPPDAGEKENPGIAAECT